MSTEVRDKVAEISIEMHGPAATHNMPCAVCRQRHAVLDLSRGVFQPCWTCEPEWLIVRKTWYVRLAAWVAGAKP